MNNRTFTFLLLLISSQLSAQQAWSNKSRLLPDSLRLWPQGITLWHAPNPVFAIRENDHFVWKHNTQVRADVADLEVVLAGSYIWYSEQGWMTNIQLSREEFAELFDCPGGILKKDVVYTFPENYRFGQQDYGGDALWFVIAKDASGHLYKGIGLVETEPAQK